MKRFFWLCVVLITMHTHTSAVLAETRGEQTGTWLLDVAASEKSMLRARPFQETTAFMMMPPMGLMFFQFEGDMLVTGTLPSVGHTFQFRRATESGSKTNYVSVDGQSMITVSALNNDNMSITYPAFPETQYLVWKRVKLDPNKKTPNDYRPEFDTYMAMLDRLWKAFGFPTGSPANPKTH